MSLNLNGHVVDDVDLFILFNDYETLWSQYNRLVPTVTFNIFFNEFQLIMIKYYFTVTKSLPQQG